jgi:glycosyltransferase involved in cell wall biosynthesis
VTSKVLFISTQRHAQLDKPYNVSICIPTCDRLDLLREAVASCASQTKPPDEIVIGDDSKGDETQALAARLQQKTAVRLSYKRNSPRLGQGANINSLYQRATGSHLVLLHDDDLLLPNAVEDLLSCWDQHPDLTAAFGKQYAISHDGLIDLAGSETLNHDYLRTPDREGLQQRPWEVGLLQQFPNNGFMVTAEAARTILWRSAEEVGYGGEFDFGLRLCLAYQKFYFLDKYTSKWRRTLGSSISSSSKDDAALQSYRIVQSVELPDEAAHLRPRKLATHAPLAMMQAIRLGYRKEAWSIYLSRHHPWRRRLSPGGMRRLLLLLLSHAKAL